MQPGRSLSKRLRNNDVDAFTEFVRANENTLLRLATRITGNVQDAEEVRQQVLMAVWQKPQTLPEDRLIQAWLHRCTVNASIDCLRKRKRTGRTGEQMEIEQEDCSRATVDECEMLEMALAQLTPDQRVLLSLRFDVPLTVREIAATLEKPHTTIQSRLNRTLTQLRSLLNKHAAGEQL